MQGAGLRRIAMAGTFYFGCVFGAGFVLGAIRVPLLVPRLGVRVAELIEMPLMLAVIVISARAVVCRFALPSTTAARLGTGVLALGIALLAEFALAFGLQGMTPAAYIAGRDPVSGPVYAVLLLLFAAMPAWVGRPRGT